MTINLEIKAADAAEVKGGGAVVTDDPMVFNIIGSVTGVVDEVNDVIEPGAYAETLRKRNPKIIKDHSWSDRLGKTLHIEEYLPGDARLPKTTSDGKPWPREAGALVGKVRLFNSAAGKEAAERWREYGPEQQYSIGYVVPPGQSARDPRTGTRRIKSLELYEISDVLWGAMPLAGPMPPALATKMLPAITAEAEGKAIDEGPDEAEDSQPLDVADLDEDVADEIPGLLASPPEAKYDTSPVGSPGGRQNWVDKAGGLPPFMRAIAHALQRNGATEEHAIAVAVAACKRWAAGGGKVSAKTRAKAAAAVADWERKKASHGKGLMDVVEQTYTDADFYGWRPDLDPLAGTKVEAPALDAPGTPRLPGTLEEDRDRIVTAVKAALAADDSHVMVVGTAEDHVIASRLVLADGEPQRIESFRIGYTKRAGLVHLDTPEPVTLALQTADGDLTPEDVHLMDAVEDATLAAKTLLLPGVEGKAGRVLSQGNGERIKNAVHALVHVLRAAGVEIDLGGPTGGSVVDVSPRGTPDAAPMQAKVLDGLPDPHELVASLRAAARAE